MDVVLAGKPFAPLRAAQGEQDREPMAQSSSCSRANCSQRVVTSFKERDFCFDHFCTRCYELLERIESAAATQSSVTFLSALAELEECAQRSLEISLSERGLSNLDRARLLDILLWSGDLTTLLRRRKSSLAKLAAREVGKGEVQELIKSGRAD